VSTEVAGPPMLPLADFDACALDAPIATRTSSRLLRDVELAEKAHKNKSRPRQPTILHPLVEKKMGRLPD
jgi:hypothetical protein